VRAERVVRNIVGGGTKSGKIWDDDPELGGEQIAQLLKYRAGTGAPMHEQDRHVGGRRVRIPVRDLDHLPFEMAAADRLHTSDVELGCFYCWEGVLDNVGGSE